MFWNRGRLRVERTIPLTSRCDAGVIMSLPGSIAAAGAPRPGSRRRRSGVVLLLVVSLLAVAGILAYALLASSSIEAEAAGHVRAALVADSMAESGINLALHYLLHPEDSPVAMVKGAFGDWHYPGQSNVGIDGDSFSVTVTNMAIATYQIDAIGTARDADGNTCTRKLRVRAVGVGQWTARGAVLQSADLSLDPDVVIEGNLVTNGQFNPVAGTVTGMKLAANYGAYTADPTWGPPPALPELVVPAFSSLDLVRAVTERSGYYAYNDSRCKVDYITSSVLSSPPVATAENPGRVFVYMGVTPLTLSGAGARTFQGTLVVANTSLIVQQNWTISPEAGMPALLVKGTTAISGTSGTLTINGIYYNGGGFTTSTTTHAAPLTVNGVMLCPVISLHTLGSTIGGPLKFTFDAARATAPRLTGQGVRYARLQIEDWEQVN